MTIEDKVWFAVLKVLFNDPQGLSQVSFEELRSISPNTQEFKDFFSLIRESEERYFLRSNLD